MKHFRQEMQHPFLKGYLSVRNGILKGQWPKLHGGTICKFPTSWGKGGGGGGGVGWGNSKHFFSYLVIAML